jgi:hypothetical protein
VNFGFILSRRAEEQKSRRAEEQKSRRAEEQKSSDDAKRGSGRNTVSFLAVSAVESVGWLIVGCVSGM